MSQAQSSIGSRSEPIEIKEEEQYSDEEVSSVCSRRTTVVVDYGSLPGSKRVYGGRGRNERSRSRDRSPVPGRRAESVRSGSPKRKFAASARNHSEPRSHKGKGFRVQGKQFCITYPRCEVSREEFDKEFKRRHPRVAQYNSAREQHEDGGYHIHVYVQYATKLDVSDARYFDLTFGSESYHPNVQKCRNKNDWLKYLTKDGDHNIKSSDLEYNPLLEQLGKRRGMYEDHKWSLEHAVQRGLKHVEWPIILNTEEKEYKMEKPVLNEKGDYTKKRNWWIVAKPNAGKTRWLNKTFAGTKIWIPSNDGYPFEGYNDAEIIIYDDREDVTFAEFSDILNVWNIVKPVFGKTRYKKQYYTMGAVRSIIVMSNKKIEDVFEGVHLNAMKARFMQIINPKLMDKEDENEDADVHEGEENAETIVSRLSMQSIARRQQEMIWAAMI